MIAIAARVKVSIVVGIRKETVHWEVDSQTDLLFGVKISKSKPKGSFLKIFNCKIKLNVRCSSVRYQLVASNIVLFG